MKLTIRHLVKQMIETKEYTTKLSVSICYAIIASVAMNLFWLPGNIYASGITGLAQIISTIFSSVFKLHLPVSITLYLLNIPLFFLAWYKISRKFTIFTILTVSLTSLAIQFIPQVVLSTDPIICAVFGGAISGFGIGFALKNGLSSGGLDIITLTIQKFTDRSIGSIAIYFNVFVIIMAALLFGWPYAFYSALSIFVSGKVTDAIYTKQQKLQVIIVTRHPEQVIESIQQRLRRGITIIHGAEGAFHHDQQTVLVTVITRYERANLQEAMKEADETAFVSIADNVKILGHFYDPGI